MILKSRTQGAANKPGTWYYPDADNPEYQAAIRKSMTTQPEVAALAKISLGDKIYASMEQAGINKALASQALEVGDTKLSMAEKKLADTSGDSYNDVLRRHYGLALYKEQAKDPNQNFWFKNILGATGAGLAGYAGYKKLQMADTLGAADLQKFLAGYGG